MKRKPTIGQTLICRERRHRGSDATTFEVVVSSVGRKYFETTRDHQGRQYSHGKFLLSDWGLADSNARGNYPTTLFESEDEMRESLEHGSLANSLEKHFRDYGNPWRKLTLDQLRAINEIVKPEPAKP